MGLADLLREWRELFGREHVVRELPRRSVKPRIGPL